MYFKFIYLEIILFKQLTKLYNKTIDLDKNLKTMVRFGDNVVMLGSNNGYLTRCYNCFTT